MIFPVILGQAILGTFVILDAMEKTIGLEARENTFRTILRTIPDLLYIFDRDGQFISFSPTEDEEDPLFRTDEYSGRYITDIFDNDVAASFKKAIEQTLSDGYFALEYEIITDRIQSFYAKFSRLNENEAVCLIRDISEQRESEQELRESEEKYHNLIENINEVIYEIDASGVVTYISPSIERLSGFSPKDIIGKTISIFSGQDPEINRARMKLLVEKKETKNDYLLYMKDGQERWIRFSTKAILSEGKLKGGTGTLIDITEKKKKEIELQKNEEKYRLLAENIADVIWVFNLNQKRYTYISPSVLQLRGYTAEEALRQDLSEGMTHDSYTKVSYAIQTRINDFLINPEERIIYYDELQQVCKDGSILWIETNTSFQLSEKGEVEIIGVSRNIEKRKRAEQQLIGRAEELKISREKFSGVFNMNPVAMVVSDPESGVLIDVNDMFIKTLGYSKEELIGKNFMKLGIFQGDSQLDKINKILSGRTLVNDFESIVKSKSGKILHFLISTTSITIDEREFWLASAVDVTTLKEHENQIRHLLNQQKLLADISQLLNLRINISSVLDHVLTLIGNHTEVSRVYILENLADGEKAGKSHEWCKEGIRSGKEYMINFNLGKIPSWKRILQNDGYLFTDNINTLPEDVYNWLNLQDIKSIIVYPLFIEGVLSGAICFDECNRYKAWSSDEIDLIKTVSVIISNAMERKRNLDLLANSELRLKLAIDSAKEGIWDWNMLTGKISLSESFYRISGYEPDDIPADQVSWESLIHPDDLQLFGEISRKTLDPENNYFEISYRLRRKDGSWQWVLDHGKIIERDSDNQPVRSLGTRIDITEQKQSEQKYRELLETQDELFSIIANDLRGPIGSFSQGLDMLTGTRQLDDNIKSKLLEELTKASRATYNLLENLLTLSRSQTGSLRIEPVHFRVKELLDINIDQIASGANQKNIRININVDDNLSVFADKNSIDIVIRNLLSNAIKFTPSGGKIDITAHADGESVELEVADNGVGIRKDIAEKLFSSNSYGSSFGTNKEKGSGIGLTLCRDLMEKNGGAIRVLTSEDKGSKFILTIPGTGLNEL